MKGEILSSIKTNKDVSHLGLKRSITKQGS